MIRDYNKEKDKRIQFIKDTAKNAGATTIVFGSSGGKDSALAGILCKLAIDNTIGIIMPSESKRNYEEDRLDALSLSKAFNIKHIEIDIGPSKKILKESIENSIGNISYMADINIAPRLRMATLYSVASTMGAIVCGTGNKSENHMGYFTKWGDSASDFNPISDLTTKEVFEFLKFLDAPSIFYTKSPSAGLFDGQTDESDMGVSYKEIDEFLLYDKKGENYKKIEESHKATEHKRQGIKKYN